MPKARTLTTQAIWGTSVRNLCAHMEANNTGLCPESVCTHAAGTHACMRTHTQRKEKHYYFLVWAQPQHGIKRFC